SFVKGIKAPIFLAKITSEIKIKNDILKIYNND
ncbi:MAG: diaminohydroxyphosphoribosylaminopyrimidine deaminase, partial [Polaribacter sp.]